MGIDAAEVCGNQRVGDESRRHFRHTGGLNQALGELAEGSGVDEDLCRHDSERIAPRTVAELASR